MIYLLYTTIFNKNIIINASIYNNMIKMALIDLIIYQFNNLKINIIFWVIKDITIFYIQKRQLLLKVIKYDKIWHIIFEYHYKNLSIFLLILSNTFPVLGAIIFFKLAATLSAHLILGCHKQTTKIAYINKNVHQMN